MTQKKKKRVKIDSDALRKFVEERGIPDPPPGLLCGAPPPTTLRGKLARWWRELQNDLYQVYARWKWRK